MAHVRHAPVGLTLAALAWGAIAFELALRTNTGVYDLTGWSRNTVVNYVAPLFEELFKAAFIVFLVRSQRVTRATTCLFCGFASGIGFSLVENLFYVSIGGGTESSLIRVGSTTLMHASSTALIGLAILRSRQPTESRRSWMDRFPQLSSLRAAASVALRIGLLRVAVKGVVLKGVLLRALVSGERRHTTFNVVVDRPVGPFVIASAVGLGLVFLVSMLFTARRIARDEPSVLAAASA